ncbi:hypothetical protein CC2G_008656 [Coprinopsis cinerea AmutBmut pab1-1]|nr:hypothetical protein CC2G_008656 [Coprinopsis cinerea AmutBmut pab1-1]
MTSTRVPDHLDQRLLSTNEPPNTEEELAVRKYVDTVSKDIEDEEAEPRRLSQLFSDCHGRIRHLNEHRDKARGIVSPLRRLPSELIAEIFKAALKPHDNNYYQRHDFANYRAVCRQWRDAAYSHPELWAALTISSSDFDFAVGAPAEF